MAFDILIGVVVCVPVLVVGWLVGLSLGRFLTARISGAAAIGFIVVTALTWADIVFGNAFIGFISASERLRDGGLLLGIFFGLPLMFGCLFGWFFAWADGVKSQDDA